MSCTGVRTTCPYCGVGCGVVAQRSSEGLTLRGDPDHPANRGALCSKGAALDQTLGLDGRLLRPRLRGQEVDWDVALNAVASGFRQIIERDGPDAVALYVSGQLLTEDYYVANKLMKGYIGSANIDTNSRLCMASAVAAHKRAFGEDLVPVCYEDLELADLIVLVGSNAAWCHPVLHQRIVAVKQQRPDMRLVVIDPRRTPTCELADLHLPVRAGTDTMLFNGLLAWLSQHGYARPEFIEQHTRGAARALLTATNTAGDASAVARYCGLGLEAVTQFFNWFAQCQRVISAFSQGVNQSVSGTDKANSIINVHLLTARIGQPGMGPFSITGQPNAMGGREVGGLATTLAAHMELDNSGHRRIVQQFWGSPRIADRAGLKAVDLFDAIHQRRVKAVWIMATNPVVSLPNAERAREALRRCELVVVSDCVANTDTTRLGHVLLPAAAWGEKDGTVTNSDRHISRQRAFLSPAGESRPDWWIVCQVARRLGFSQGFNFTEPHQIFDEHARLSAAENAGARAFNLSGLVDLGAQGYDQLAPVAWPVPVPPPGGTARGTARLFTDQRFFHADQRARFIAVRPRAPRYARDAEYPLILNTGRIRDQWHSMTRTGCSARLSLHLPEPFVDMHAADALAFGLRSGSLVRVSTRWGSLIARLRTSGEMARGTLFVPIHWSASTASDARVGVLVNPVVDPFSGEPEFKHTPARVEPFLVSWYGFLLSRRPTSLHSFSWWVGVAGESHLRYEIAGRQVPGNWSSWARTLLDAGEHCDWIDYDDAATCTYRAAYLKDERLEACVFISDRPELPPRRWLAGLFDQAIVSTADRADLLSGRPGNRANEAGPIVCACFNVGRDAIEGAIVGGCRDPGTIGQRLRAGTNCGSCLPEITRLLAQSGKSTLEPA